MKLNSVTTGLLLWTSSVSADFLSAKSRHVGNNVDLGHLNDVADFHLAIGHHNGTWEDVTEYETYEEEHKSQGLGQSQSLNPSAPQATGLFRRSDYCSDMTGITKMVCDNVPSRNWFWGAGGGLAIYYSPRVLAEWLNQIAVLIKAHRNLKQVFYNQKGHDELKRRQEDPNAIDYHFSLPYLLDHKGKPDHSSLRPRNLHARGDGDDHDADVDLKHDYVFSQRDGILFYKASSLAFSPKAAAAASSASASPSSSVVASASATPSQSGTHTLQARGTTSDYTINMIITKHSSQNTIASTTCLAKMLKYHLDASSKEGRFSCRPIDNKGKWRATMHLMINKGKNNKGAYGTCCD